MSVGLEKWIADMKELAPNPVLDKVYHLHGNFYKRIPSKKQSSQFKTQWYRLTSIEVINMYVNDTDGCMSPEKWASSLDNPNQAIEEKK